MKALRTVIGIAGLALLSSNALSQTLISHTKAINGNVSPNDTPGYPITLSASGAYKLTSNLLVPPGGKGIHIIAQRVTLDLNGFVISGGGLCNSDALLTVTCSQTYMSGPGAAGIHVEGYYATIKNGHVNGFSGDGLLVNRTTTVDTLQISDNAGHGIKTTTSEYNTLEFSNVFIYENRLTGIEIDTPALIDRARVERNGGKGIDGGPDVLVINSVVRKNKTIGLNDVAARSTVSAGNGTMNRNNVISLGSNLDAGVTY